MTEDIDNQKQARKRKTPETIRERADKHIQKKDTPKRKLRSKIHRPLSVLHRISQKEYHPIPVPKNKAGKVLGKRVHIIPKFIREASTELKNVTWPTRRVALKLTGSVIIFAVVFSIFVQVLDIIFNKLFKEVILK